MTRKPQQLGSNHHTYPSIFFWGVSFDGFNIVDTVDSFETIDGFDTIESIEIIDTIESIDTFEIIDMIENIESYRIHQKKRDRWIMLQIMK